MKSRVTGSGVELGVIGNKPVGQAEVSATAYFDYRLPWMPELSVDLGIQHLGKRPGNVENTLMVPGRTLVDLGARYRFQMAKLPATFRFELSNLFDTYAWNVTGGGGLRRVFPRRAQGTLSVDF